MVDESEKAARLQALVAAKKVELTAARAAFSWSTKALDGMNRVHATFASEVEALHSARERH